MGKSDYLRVKYQIPYEYSSFTKSKTKNLNRYVLFKFIYNLLLEMYYSISCYKLLTRWITARFNRSYKYTYILRSFITNFLNHLYKSKYLSLYIGQKQDWPYYAESDFNLNSTKVDLVDNAPYILFIKFFVLLLRRRNTFSNVLRKEKTILYHVRQISNYVFYERHTRILFRVKQSTLSYDLRKRILDSIFNINRYSRKHRFAGKKYIFNLVSFNMVMSSKRFDRLKKGRKSRTFYSQKLKFVQLYKNMFNIKTTKMFKEYIQFIVNRLQRFVGIASIYFHQIYLFLSNYFFYYLDILRNNRELHSLTVLVNNKKNSVSSFYYLLVGDRIEVRSTFLTYIFIMRKLCISFILSQIFYNYSTVLPIRTRNNKRNFGFITRKLNRLHINKYLLTDRLELNSFNHGTISTTINKPMYSAYLSLYTGSAKNKLNILKYRSKTKAHTNQHSRRTQHIVRTKKTTHLFKKLFLRNNRYRLIGHVFDALPVGVRIKILAFRAIIGIYLQYSNVLDVYMASNIDHTLWYNTVCTIVSKHLHFIMSLHDCRAGLYVPLQLCNFSIGRLITCIAKNHYYNIYIKKLDSVYIQFFNFSKKSKYYFNFTKFCGANLIPMIHENKILGANKRIYISSNISLFHHLCGYLNNGRKSNTKKNFLKYKWLRGKNLNNWLKVINPTIFTRKILPVRIYKIVYYCLIRVVKYIGTARAFKWFNYTILPNYSMVSKHVRFFPNLHILHHSTKQSNLLYSLTILLYMRKLFVHNRKNTRFFFFRMRKRFKKRTTQINNHRPELRRGYNFSIIQNNDYFRRLGIHDLRSFVKKVFIDKSMPKYRPSQYKHNKITMHSKRAPHKNTQHKKHIHVPIRFYHTTNVVCSSSINKDVDHKTNQKTNRTKIRIQLVKTMPILDRRNQVYVEQHINRDVNQNNNRRDIAFGNEDISRASITSTIGDFNQDTKIELGGLVIAMLHRILMVRYLRSSHLYASLSKARKKKRKSVIVHHRHLTRSVANDSIIDLAHLDSVAKHYTFTDSHDDLFRILKRKSTSRKLKYATMLIRVFVNMYSYLQYIKQWFSRYTFYLIKHLESKSIRKYSSIDLIRTLKVFTEYFATQHKFISNTPLVYKVTKCSLKFIIYGYSYMFSTAVHKSHNQIPTNLRYLFSDKSYKVLSSKFR